MIILDYDAKTELPGGIKIENGRVTCPELEMTDVTFRNYPVLRISELQVESCVFENCNTILLVDCKVDECQFADIEALCAVRTQIWDCEFKHLRCKDNCIRCLEDSDLILCTFVDVELTDGAYLVDGISDTWIECCTFVNVRTDREDGVLFVCEETIGENIVKKTQVCVADEKKSICMDHIASKAQIKAKADKLCDNYK